MPKKELPKSINDIEFVNFQKRDIDTNMHGKPSSYLRNVLIPYYRRVINAKDDEIREIKQRKADLLKRKNEQLSRKTWLKFKSNQKRYAMQQRKVKEKATEITAKKIKKSVFEKSDLLASIYFLPVYYKVAKESGLSFNDLIYIVYTNNFRFLSGKDYSDFFGELYNAKSLNLCRKLGYIDCNKSKLNQYFLSLKGRELIKKIQKEIEELKGEDE